LISVPLMVLGFYYKQQFIAGPLAVFIYLLLERRFARAAQFAGLLAASLLGAFAIFQWAVFRGQEFWRHFLLYQSTLFSWHQFELGFLTFAFMFAAPVLLGLDYLRLHPNRMLHCYFIAAVLLGVITIGKESAFIQYFYESILLISVLIPALLASKVAAGRGALEVVVLLGIALLAGQWYTPRAPKPADVIQYNTVQNFFRQNIAPHSRVIGYRGGDLVQAGFDTPFSDLFQTELLARHGVVPDQYLLARIRDRWFSAIILDFDLEKERNPRMLDMYMTEPAREAVEQNYQIADKVAVPVPESLNVQDHFYVYVPRLGATVSAISGAVSAPTAANGSGSTTRGTYASRSLQTARVVSANVAASRGEGRGSGAN
jgi:hypothetical protein